MLKISIIIPVYNAEKYINECIDSILKNSNESLYQIEIIIINDGSTDHTLEKLEKYKKNNFIHTYTTKNQGVSAARNYGIKLAKGEWITFIDADDKVTEGFIDLSINELNKNTLLKTTILTDNYKNHDKDKVTVSIQQLLAKLIYGEEPAFIFSYFFKKDIVKQIHFNEKIHFMEDSLFLIEYLNKTNEEYNIETNLVSYLYNNNQYSASNNSKNAIRNILDAEQVFLLRFKNQSIDKQRAQTYKLKIYENQISKIDNQTDFINLKTNKDIKLLFQKEIKNNKTTLFWKVYLMSILKIPYMIFNLYKIMRNLTKELKQCLKYL